MNKNYFIGSYVIGFILVLVLFTACKKNQVDDLNQLDCTKINSDYVTDIKPIIDANCLSSGCHNGGSINGDFTTYAGIKAKADNGSLDSRVIQNKSMPLSGSLSSDQLKKIKCWLNSGSPDKN